MIVTLRSVKTIDFILNKNDSEFDSYREDIVRYWNDFCKDKTEFFDGDVVSVSDITELNNDYKVAINILKYSDVIYSKMVGNITTRALFSGGYVLTSDNYIGFVIDRKNRVNLAGGMASTEDFINDQYDPSLCMIREYKEEIGLDIDSDKFNYVIKYIKYPGDNEKNQNYYPVGVIYEIKTEYSKKELIDLFDKLKHDNELNSIFFLNFNDFSKLNNYKKNSYVDELYRLIIKDGACNNE